MRAAVEYSELRLDRIVVTLRRLRDRIGERFPDSGLGEVAQETCRLADQTGAILERARRPLWTVRVIVGVAIIVFVALVIGLLLMIPSLQVDVGGIGALLQTVEAAAQDLIFLALALFFLTTLETRIKRRRALRELHRLRTIVHIVDMHQLTKDPVILLSPGDRTASSPERRLTPFELSRYLDYCTELLSLCSKLAALHVQYVNDRVVLEAVNDIEMLVSTLSNQIWQKIVMIEPGRIAAGQPPFQD